MNLYLLEQTDRNNYGSYTRCIVAAKSEDDARSIHPCGYFVDVWSYTDLWARRPDLVTVTLLGTAINSILKGVILAERNPE